MLAALADGTELDLDVVVFAAGVRPRDQLARRGRARRRAARRHRRRRRLPHQRPGTSTRSASAPASDGRVYGLVAPGYAMAEVARRPAHRRRRHFPGADTVDQAEAARRRRRLVRRRARRRRRRARGDGQRPGAPAATPSSSSPMTRRPCSAASSSATRPGTACSGRWSGGRCPATRWRCSPRPGRDRRRRAARRRAGLLVQRRDQGRDLRGDHGPRR